MWAKSSWDPHLNQWLGMVLHSCHPQLGTEAQLRQTGLDIMPDPVSKMPNTKWSGGVA
jgi:hypothetical protein